jgi:hypothetical protein
MAPLASRAGAELLYVSPSGCNCVTVYDRRTLHEVGQISLSSNTFGIATGPDGVLWVTTVNDVEAYAPGTTTPSLRLHVPGLPIDVAVKNDGTVYVAAFNPALVFVYPKGATKPERTISAQDVLPGAIEGLTFDHAGHLVLVGEIGIDEGRIVTFGPDDASPVVAPAILATPVGAVFDFFGNLLVGDFDDATTYVFTPGAGQPKRHVGAIRTTNPTFLAFDATRSTLYVGNALRAEVDVYDYLSGTQTATLPAQGGFGSYIGVATSPRAPF